MEATASPPSQALQSTSIVDSVPDPVVQDPLPHPLSTGSTADDDSKPINSDEKTKKPRKKAKKRRISRDGPDLWPSSSSSCSSSPSSSSHPTRVVLRRRRPRALLAAPRRIEGNVHSIALPLGMSVAAVVSLVLETKDVAVGRMSADHLSMICISAVRESLVNVFGENFDYFMRNFEKSFGSTLRTLRLINELNTEKGGHHFCNIKVEGSASPMSLNNGGCTGNCGGEDFQSEAVLQTLATQDLLNTIEEVRENMLTVSNNRVLTLHGQTNQVACVLPNTPGPVIGQSMVSTIQKSVIEQTRSNDLKSLELGLTMRRLKLKETQLALNFDSNNLERSKLEMGASKASFKEEKFKSQLEDMRHTELLRKCVDCLVAGLLVMSASLLYGAYVFSYRRITEATESCTTSPEEYKSWWIPKPMASFNSGLHVLRCQVQVVSRMLFGVLMIVAIACLLLQRSASAKQMMPITFMLLLLGVACGFAGKLCVDTLGGSGYHWLLNWEILCVLHFISNVYTPFLFLVLHGPVNVSQGTKGKAIFPYWIRRVMFYAIMFLFLPLFCGLVPFASLGEWKDHFLLLVTDYLFTDE
ncbi:protein CPR-5-like isoform X2 [Juglans microcarpa x Juglans regia]|uniref:protein CPR-5-like isoform X2 n=1 Tax=Juglans microcarpa x Juglans regia TaxID=2249226 RepID=UPI001B7DB41A|nr:protein CPR-5-like isoform X2 [Juglans microcarpa x Juglans regia]